MLTEQKLKYVALRRAGVEKKQAAIGAKYSAKTASQAASRLERDPEVREAIDAREGEFLPKSMQEKRPPPPKIDPDEPVSTLDTKEYTDSKQYLIDTMNDKTLSKALRHDAAKVLMPFQHAKKGELGKKETRDSAAKKVSETTPFRPRVVN